MGMVLPEGVLNNKNLQAVREYFEGKAKIILICSIPQDVFIAAGATVKPSLVFMRKFTDEEEQEYAKCQSEALNEVTALHQPEIDALKTLINDCNNIAKALKSDLKVARENFTKAKKAKTDTVNIGKTISDIQLEQKSNKATQKAKEKELKELMNQIIEETKPVVKKKFDYDIPIAKIDDAGITTTGAASSGNQLPQLVQEYRDYQLNNSLWNSDILRYEYRKNATDEYCRIAKGKEVILSE